MDVMVRNKANQAMEREMKTYLRGNGKLTDWGSKSLEKFVEMIGEIISERQGKTKQR